MVTSTRKARKDWTDFKIQISPCRIQITRDYAPILSPSREPPPNVPKIAMKGLQELVSGPDPKEQVKKWKAAMRGESRKIDRNIRGPVWRVNPLHIRKST